MPKEINPSAEEIEERIALEEVEGALLSRCPHCNTEITDRRADKLGDKVHPSRFVFWEKNAYLEAGGSTTAAHGKGRCRSLVRKQRDEAIECLMDMVRQHADGLREGQDVNGHGLSTHADAILFLEKMGKVKVTGGVGRCIYGVWIHGKEETQATDAARSEAVPGDETRG